MDDIWTRYCPYDIYLRRRCIPFENTESFESRFRKKFLSLKEEFIKAGNPFEETGEALYTLVSKNILNLEAKKSVYEARTLGKNRYHQYKHNIFILGTKNVYETLKRNKLSLFRNKNTVTISKTQLKVTSLKQDCHLFSSLFVACQSRDGDMAQFFAHENHTYPPTLSVYGDLRIAHKSDMLKILLNISEPLNIRPTCTAEVLDDAAVVQCIVPRASSNFDQYCNTEFLSFVSQKYNSYQLSRIYIVFDVYLENTIKVSARAKRGVGKRIRVTASTPPPKNWKMFLHVSENKTELFHLIAATIKNYKGNEKIVVTKDNCVLSNFPFEDKIMSPWNHQEADTRMFVHVRSLVLTGHTDIIISTVDTDVIVIAISCYEKLARFRPSTFVERV